MAAIRRAEAIWEGTLRGGEGHVTAQSSGVFEHLPVTWASRTEAADKTSPEELIAAAHASCFAMALSLEIEKAGAKPRRLEVTAAVAFDKTPAGYRIVSSDLEVGGIVDGLDAARFAEIARAAKEGCPVSQALKGNVKIDVEAALGGPETTEKPRSARSPADRSEGKLPS
ncbi:MAG TPA: OsmC family peroxiredoxin [Planctomycetota bacterium]|nr:OsmC family peroxiredoxin [Planctomycetota bacterium]